MKILVACEESQAVTIEMRKLGHEAYSCDIIDQSGGHHEWHIKQDVLPLLNGDCTFITTDGKKHEIKGEWDMIIAFPPCTHLAISGAVHFKKKRDDGRQREAIEFFAKVLNANCSKKAIENPIGIISGKYILKHFPDLCLRYNLPVKADQVIHPWQFGDEYEKSTCLWLNGLPKLVETNVVRKGEFITFSSGKKMPKWYADAFKLKPEDRAKERSKTFPGIAKAMAEQWAGKMEEL